MGDEYVQGLREGLKAGRIEGRAIRQTWTTLWFSLASLGWAIALRLWFFGSLLG